MNVYVKYAITAALVVAISEVAKRSDRLGALIGALPWVTTLAMIWLYVESQGADKIGNHARYTFWYVLPTLPMFLAIPWLLERGWPFPAVLAAYAVGTWGLFWLTAWVGKAFGVVLMP